jgi:riboflavin kinase/FMN adenylyltransferase
MKVYHSLESYHKGHKGAVATIGTFDGVHHGHRKILAQLRAAAGKIGAESVVISFHPHPRLVLFPDDNPMKLLQTLEERIEAFASTGIDKLLLIPFTREFSRWTSERFIQDILVDTVGIQRIVIGYDHHFGKNRTGGIRELEDAGRQFGFEVEEIPAQQIDKANVSSTKIRQALDMGDIRTANRFLTYPYPVSGEVVHGEKMGRTLGYPTANIALQDPQKLIPAQGVYLCRVLVDGKPYHGMANIGKKPTVGNDFPLGLEVNIFDFSGDVYGKHLTVQFLEWIREDRKFGDLQSLIQAIDQDKEACLKLLQQDQNGLDPLKFSDEAPAIGTD